MEWNWCWHGNDVSQFMLCESSGDSEEVKSNIHHHHHHDYNYDESTMDDVSFRFGNKEDVDVVDDDDNDDDAESCSYDHSSYINTSYGTSHIDQSQRLTYDDHDIDDDDGDSHIDQSQRLTYDDHDIDDDDGDVVVAVDDDDDNKMINKNWGESKLMDSSKQQKRSHKFCDSLSQREIDKQFWETCLAS